MRTEREWGSMEEAATLLGVSVKTVRRRITDGSINAKRFGPRLIKVHLSSLEQGGRSLQYRGGEAR